MVKTVIVKIGSLYVTSDGGLSPSQSDALRIDVPQSCGDQTASPRIVSLKVRS